VTDVRSVDERLLTELLPVGDAVDALERAFRDGLPASPQRQHLDVGAGDLLVMPAWSASGTGVKLVTVNHSNPARGIPLIHGLYVLFDPMTLAEAALFDASALTGLRTAAVSALATRFLARRGARRLVVFGAGVQARWHVRVLTQELALDDIAVIARSEDSVRALAADLAGDAEVRPGSVADVGSADVVCCCTTSAKPLFPADVVAPGIHINAVGAYKPTARELDASLLARSRVVVEDRSAALAEAGDIVMAIAEGAMTAGDVAADLSEVVRGAPVRRSPGDVTVFKSVGMAAEDLVVAAAAAARL
jgi:ornithine cyclodeaminase